MKRKGDGFYPKIDWHRCPKCNRKGYYQKYSFLEHNWHCKYCGYDGYAPKEETIKE